MVAGDLHGTGAKFQLPGRVLAGFDFDSMRPIPKFMSLEELRTVWYRDIGDRDAKTVQSTFDIMTQAGMLTFCVCVCACVRISVEGLVELRVNVLQGSGASIQRLHQPLHAFSLEMMSYRLQPFSACLTRPTWSWASA